MDLHNCKSWTRREFLHSGVGLVSAAATAPWFLTGAARAMQNPNPALASQPGVPDERILVLVQLAGGNDGLNTVIPFGDEVYYRSRPGIGIPEAQALSLGGANGIGLHPQLANLKELFDDGLVAVVQGVGYPNPNRSHFTSMDIWHTAKSSGIGDGWLGRYFDNDCDGAPHTCSGHDAIAIGREAPLALLGREHKPISFESEKLFRWSGLDLHESLEKPYRRIVRPEHPAKDGAEGAAAAPPDAGSNAAFLRRISLDAQLASEQIRKAVGQKPLVNYPRGKLSQQLAMVAQMIRAGLETRVYYVSIGGFDTHAGQGGGGGRHANLLRQVAEGINAFYRDLKAQGNQDRVLTMSFSEFGRRVAQNGSGGTDHGTAAPMFLIGPMVAPGVHGRHPSLTDLDNGDLRFNTDFRSVYAAVLNDWLKADAGEVLGKAYPKVSLIQP